DRHPSEVRGAARGGRVPAAGRNVRAHEGGGVRTVMLIAGAVFALILAIIWGTYWMFILLPQQQEDSALRKRIRGQRKQVVARTDFVKAQESLSSVKPVARVLNRFSHLVDPLQSQITQAGLKVNVGTVVLASVFCGTLTLTIVAALQPSVI